MSSSRLGCGRSPPAATGWPERPGAGEINVEQQLLGAHREWKEQPDAVPRCDARLESPRQFHRNEDLVGSRYVHMVAVAQHNLGDMPLPPIKRVLQQVEGDSQIACQVEQSRFRRPSADPSFGAPQFRGRPPRRPLGSCSPWLISRSSHERAARGKNDATHIGDPPGRRCPRPSLCNSPADPVGQIAVKAAELGPRRPQGRGSPSRCDGRLLAVIALGASASGGRRRRARGRAAKQVLPWCICRDQHRRPGNQPLRARCEMMPNSAKATIGSPSAICASS